MRCGEDGGGAERAGAAAVAEDQEEEQEGELQGERPPGQAVQGIGEAFVLPGEVLVEEDGAAFCGADVGEEEVEVGVVIEARVGEGAGLAHQIARPAPTV